jgi:acetylornithine/succinyldiaminopimelate/putrescine aminotransferase
METVQAEAGIMPPTEGYLQTVRKRCDETGALLILDEIQAGMGRTGSLWAFEQYGIVPDVLLLAKGLGGGMPIGAFIANKHMMSTLAHDPVLGHITTFGGHPLSCAAALATLQTLLDTDLIYQVKKKEALFLKHLKHAKIQAVRSAGLWLAVELNSFFTLQKVIQECLKNGVVTDWFLFNNTCLRIAPPLVITEEEVLWACQIILEALDKIYD